MRIAILGAGAGGHAMAADLTLKGHQVTLASRNPDKVRDLRERGAIETHGGILGERVVPFDQATTDIPAAVSGADLVVLPVPGMVQAPYLRACLPHLKVGQALWLTPGTGGSLLAHRIRQELGVARDVLLIETLTLPFGCRKSGPARVGVVVLFKPRCAAFPARRNAEALALLRQLYELPAAENVLDTALGNPNCLIHPLPGLLNYGWIEHRGRDYSVYGEGMTPSVVKGVYALDRERVAVLAAAGIRAPDLDELYQELGPGPVWRQFMGVGKAEKFEDRFFTEDVPVGLVTVSSFGAQLGAPTPLIDATIALSSMLFDTDFRAVGRTAESLGVGGLGPRQLAEYLHEGR
jgi:opine dehydrogenase